MFFNWEQWGILDETIYIIFSGKLYYGVERKDGMVLSGQRMTWEEIQEKIRGRYNGNGEKLDCHMILYKIFCIFTDKVRDYFA